MHKCVALCQQEYQCDIIPPVIGYEHNSYCVDDTSIDILNFL